MKTPLKQKHILTSGIETYSNILIAIFENPPNLWNLWKLWKTQINLELNPNIHSKFCKKSTGL